VLQKYDPLRLERAGELLYELYRNIRYSVSPRFELETLVSKLCWLEKWISPLELGDAVARTQELLKVNRPLAGQKTSGDTTALSNENLMDKRTYQHSDKAASTVNEQSSSLTEEFNRRIAARGNSAPPRTAEDHDTAVKNVLSVFDGTIVEEN
jgi:DNA polymerase-3 subunit gamma/tau